MGRRGPQKTPTATLAARGSWRAKIRTGEPVPPDQPVIAPEWLGDAGRAVWSQIAPALEAMGVLTQIDTGALGRYCELWVRWIHASKYLREHGETCEIRDKYGESVGEAPRSQVAIVAKLSELLARLEREFGLTPAARAGISISENGKAKPTDEKSKFFRIRAG